MKACFVCATTWQADQQECDQCRTPLAELDGLARLTRQPRFLFGSVRQETPESGQPTAPVPVAKPRPVRKAAVAAKPKPKPKPAAAPPVVPEDEIFSRDEPILDVAALERPKRFEQRKRQVLMVMIDLITCLTLNFLVFKLILMVSDRGLIPLVNLSLIPLMFVLLGFTALYFWMFHHIFERTFGGIMAEQIMNRLKKRAS